MDKLMGAVQYVLNLGPTVILPLAILVIGMIFGTGFKKAFKAGMIIGIGFVGINLVIGLLVNNLGPAAQEMVKRFGLNLTVIDTGWPSAFRTPRGPCRPCGTAYRPPAGRWAANPSR